MVANCIVFMLQSYSSRRAFIAAQSPMLQTKNDIWELIWQFRVSTIVLLCRFREDSNVRVFIYSAAVQCGESFLFHLLPINLIGNLLPFLA